MSATQTFVWGSKATLEIKHKKCEMSLSVTSDVASSVRLKMKELNEGGMYPNNEISSGSIFSQFVITGEYNWNSRWRDFRKIIDKVLGINSTEQV